MNTISEAAINKTWQRINEAAPEDTKARFDRMGKQQPFIVAYMLAVEETLVDETERGTLLFLTLMIYEIMSAGRRRPPQITGAQLETAEAANAKFLEDLEGGSEMGYLEGLGNLMATYNQMPLFGAVLEALMADHAEEPEMADENVGMYLLHLKSIIDCLDLEAPQTA